MKKPSFSKARGFTLIELLIVIAIIAILSGILITSLTGSKAKSRDGKRVSDISQIQLAIEQYFDRCQQYPVPSGGGTVGALTTGAGSGTCTSGGTGITLGNFISQIPTPPSGASANYDYAVNSASNPTDYILHTTLETSNAALQDSVKSSSLVGTWAAALPCTDNASHALDYCVGSK